MHRELKAAYEVHKSEIKDRLNEFAAKKTKDEVFMELCFCLLTPQSSAQRCWNAILELKKSWLLYTGTSEQIVPVIASARFNKTKARRVVDVREKYDDIYDKIKNGASSIELREWLVENVKGYGYKEASHFMRNIGFTDIAILDRHILRCLMNYGVIDNIPTMTKKNYLELEKKFFIFSKCVGVEPAALDLLLWSMQTGKIFK